MTLRRLIVEFKPDGIQLRTLYSSAECPDPSTKKRLREVAQLEREGTLSAGPLQRKERKLWAS